MIIGFSGFAGVGKDTAAMQLEDQQFTRISLSDPMKRVLYQLYGFSQEQLWGPSEERNKPDERYPRAHAFNKDKKCVCCGYRLMDEYKPCFLTPRYALQLLGTEFGRQAYENTWVDNVLRAATCNEQHRSTYGYTRTNGLVRSGVPLVHTAIPDVRFRNEVQRLSEWNIPIFRIKRPGFEAPAFDHPSEAEQATIPDSAFTAVIHNDGTVEDLRANVRAKVLPLLK